MPEGIDSESPRRSRPNTLEVDLTAVAHNARELRHLIGGSKLLFAALKANAYGFGLVEVARELTRSGVNAFSVVHLADAITLRMAGISSPILLYGGHLGNSNAVGAILEYDLITTLVDQDSIEIHGKYSNEPIHAFVKVDVGLERLGVHSEGAVALIQTLQRYPNIQLDGVYTHMDVGPTYAGPEALPTGIVAPYLAWQLESFQSVLDSLRRAGVRAPMTLAASSPAILLAQGLEYDAVDPGRLFFGILPPGPTAVSIDLKPAFHSLRSRLIQVKPVLRSNFMEQTGFAVRPGMYIGIIPMGFADGLTFATCGQVLVRGKRVEVIGTFLEHARLDLSEVPTARAGDEVVVVGRQGDAEITSGEVAAYQRFRTPGGLAAVIRESVERVYIR